MKKGIILFLIIISIVCHGYMAQAGIDEDVSDSELLPDLITLDVKDADIKDVFKMLTKKSGINIVADEDVSGLVTMYIKDVDIMQALNMITSANDLVYKEEGGMIRVMSKDSVKEKPEDNVVVEVIKLKYANASEVANVIDQMKTKDGRIMADPESNIITLVDTFESMIAMKEIISTLDMKPEEIKKSDNKKERPVKKEKKNIQVVEKNTSDTDLTPYEKYYWTVRSEIYKTVKEEGIYGLKGKVELEFTLDKDGYLKKGPIVLNKPDLRLVRAAVNSVKNTSPFPPFSKAMERDTAPFYIVVRYE